MLLALCEGELGSSSPVYRGSQETECYPLSLNLLIFLFFLKGQELGYEISCLLDVMILACSVSHVGSQMFVMLLFLRTYIWAA